MNDKFGADRETVCSRCGKVLDTREPEFRKIITRDAYPYVHVRKINGRTVWYKCISKGLFNRGGYILKELSPDFFIPVPKPPETPQDSD